MATLTSIGQSHAKQVKVTMFGTEQTSGTYRTAYHTSSDVKTGTKNPNWRSQVRNVQQAGTPYSRVFDLNGFVTGQVAGTFKQDGGQALKQITETLSGQLFLDSGPGSPVLPNISHVDIQARLNFIKKCRGHQRAFQGGVFLGELRDAIRMITRPASALRRSISNYSTAVKKAARRAKGPGVAKAISGTWLEYVYGWRPLFADVDAGMAALADTSHLVPEVVSGFGRDTWYSDASVYGTSADGFSVQALASFRARYEGRVRYLGCVAWDSANLAGDWQSHWGVTLSDFAPTIWELIPYSFLVDYFSNIGAVIDASSFGTVSVRWGVCSSKTEASVELGDYRGQVFGSQNYDASATASLGLSPLSKLSFNRSIFDSIEIGIADIRFQIPGVGDWRKWANIAALATQKVL